jgi:hypothetical protein
MNVLAWASGMKRAALRRSSARHHAQDKINSRSTRARERVLKRLSVEGVDIFGCIIIFNQQYCMIGTMSGNRCLCLRSDRCVR